MNVIKTSTLKSFPLALLICTFLSIPVQAFDFSTLSSSSEDYVYDSYFEIEMKEVNAKIELLHFYEFEQKFPKPRTKYNRNSHFGTWIEGRNDGSCLNTRGKVLERDSKSKVTLGGARGCTVLRGDWQDPYSGNRFRSADDVQIDHFVPLKHAYMTGAYQWTKARRCLYSNYLGSNYHLLAVSGSENGEKGDKSPVEYLPPETGYTCQYLSQWLRVKAIWKLRLTPTEVETIRSEVERNSCKAELFQMTQAEFQAQLNFIENNLDLCSN